MRRGQGVRKSIAIISNDEAEWFYFESLRIYHRYSFKVAPDFPSDSDIDHILKLSERYLKEGYNHIICLIDTNRIHKIPAEWQKYQDSKKKSTFEKVMFIETYPCMELWFLLHFLPCFSAKAYHSYEELLPELEKYLPNYKKTKKYFGQADIYRFLKENGSLETAVENAKKLCELSKENIQDDVSYCEIYKVIELLRELEPDKK